MHQDGGEAADRGQVVGVEHLGHLLRVGREEPVRAELGRGEADVVHLGEHPFRGELVAPVRDLADTPGDGRTGDPVLGGGDREGICVQAGTSHDCRTSSIRTGRCCCRDRVAASAMKATARASSTVHGDVRRPATTSVKAWSSAWKAPVSRSMKNVAGGPAGQVAPGSRLRRGVVSLQPAATLSRVPCSSSLTSWPRGLYRVLDTTAVAPSSKVSSVEAVATSPNSAKKSAPLALPVA